MANAASFTLVSVYFKKAVISSIDSTIGTIHIAQSTADTFVSIPLRNPLRPIFGTERFPLVLFKQ
jgi:hypothetical protein